MPSPNEISFLLLILTRCLSFFAMGPVFGSSRIPTQIKLLLALVTALALSPTVDRASFVMPNHVLGLAVLLCREVLLGALLGFVAQAAFTGIRMAGDLIGLQMGLSIGTIVDPQHGEVTMLGLMQELVAVFLFVIMDGHHLFLRALASSLNHAPPGAFPSLAALPALLLPILGFVLLVCLQVGAPILAALFLTDAALGFVARAVPQLNVFVLGIQVKLAVGIVFLIVTAPLLAQLLQSYMNRIDGQLLAILGGM